MSFPRLVAATLIAVLVLMGVFTLLVMGGMKTPLLSLGETGAPTAAAPTPVVLALSPDVESERLFALSIRNDGTEPLCWIAILDRDVQLWQKDPIPLLHGEQVTVLVPPGVYTLQVGNCFNAVSVMSTEVTTNVLVVITNRDR